MSVYKCKPSIIALLIENIIYIFNFVSMIRAETNIPVDCKSVDHEVMDS